MEDGSRDTPARGTLPPPICPGATVPGATVPSTAASSSGQKRRAEDPPDDPRLDGQGQAEVVLDTVDKRYARRCATCECSFASSNQLHRHLRKHQHQRLGSAPRARTSTTVSRQQFREESRQHFVMSVKPTGCDVPFGSVMELPPGVDEAGSQPLQSQHAQGQIAGETKPVVVRAVDTPG